MTCEAIIPARGGSKRIPGKNIREFGGLPMISHSIAAALDSHLFGRVIVSTNDPQIMEIASAHTFHIFPVYIESVTLGKTRVEVMAGLRESGVGTKVHSIPACLQPYYRDRLGTSRGQFLRAEDFFQRELWIPIYPAMSDADVHSVVAAVREIMKA